MISTVKKNIHFVYIVDALANTVLRKKAQREKNDWKNHGNDFTRDVSLVTASIANWLALFCIIAFLFFGAAIHKMQFWRH